MEMLNTKKHMPHSSLTIIRTQALAALLQSIFEARRMEQAFMPAFSSRKIPTSAAEANLTTRSEISDTP